MANASGHWPPVRGSQQFVDLAEDLVDPQFDAGFGLGVQVGVVEYQADAR